MTVVRRNPDGLIPADEIPASGAGAPADAAYITQIPNATLTNEQALSALTTGVLKSTTGTGVVSIAVPGTDFETAGTMTAHLAAGDPHPQYLTAAEGAAAFDALGAAAAAQAASAPLVHAPRHQAGGADPIKLDDLAAPDDNTDLNASTGAHGLMQKYPGGTSNFLRADGAFAAPTASVAVTAATLSAVPYDTQYAEKTVTDAAIGATSKLTIGWGMFTEADENTPDMDQVDFTAIAAAGSMTVRLSTSGRLGGSYKIQYTVAA